MIIMYIDNCAGEDNIKCDERINDATFAELKFMLLKSIGIASSDCDWIKVKKDGKEEKVLEDNERDKISKALFEEPYKELEFKIIQARVYEDTLDGWALTDYGFHFKSNNEDGFCIPYKQISKLTDDGKHIDDSGVIFINSKERISYEKMITNEQDRNVIIKLLMDIRNMKIEYKSKKTL